MSKKKVHTYIAYIFIECDDKIFQICNGVFIIFLFTPKTGFLVDSQQSSVHTVCQRGIKDIFFKESTDPQTRRIRFICLLPSAVAVL